MNLLPECNHTCCSLWCNHYVFYFFSLYSHRRSRLSNTNEWELLPPDYTLTVLALIQGICHAFLLSVGNASLPVMSSRKVNSLQQTSASLRGGNPPTVSQLTGLPDSIEGALEIAEILYHHKLNPPNPSGPIPEVNNTVPAFDPLFPSPLTENVDHCSNTNNPSVDNVSNLEPSVILTSGIGDDKVETTEMSVHSPSSTVIFLNRAKVSRTVTSFISLFRLLFVVLVVIFSNDVMIC